MASTNENQQSLANKAADLKRLENILQAATALMVQQVKHEDVAIFIGATKSGKSSLINYLIGNNLIGKKPVLCRPFSIEKADNSDGPQIGRGAASETIIPTRWENPVKLPGLVIWDAPGFEDNRGSVQDITNAFYIYELFKNIKSAKIVLVTDVIDIIRDQINSFLLILQCVENFLKHSMRNCFPSIVVVFTKVPDIIHDCQVDKAFIQDVLKHQFLSSTSLNISDVGKDFVRYLIDNTQNIGFFKQATSGPITDAIDGGVIQAIQSAKPVDESILREVIFPSIAPSSKVFLFESREQLSSMGAFTELQSSINNVFIDRLNQYSRIQEDEPSRQKLLFTVDELGCLREKIGNGLQPNVNFYKKIDIMRTVDSTIENQIRDGRLLEKAKLMEFVDGLLDLKETKHFDFNLQGIMMTAASKVDEIIIAIRLKLNEIDKKTAEAQVEVVKQERDRDIQSLKTELEKVKHHNQQARKKFGFFSFIGGALDSLFGRWF